MRRRAVLWSADAVDDLDSIAAYIAEDNPFAAERIAKAIREAADDLGEAATGRRGRTSGVYEKLVPSLPHIIAYALHSYSARGEAVVILRVIHGARNWPEGGWPED